MAARLQRGPLPLDEALPIARQIADALEAAHDKGIVHRDLKPANIALTAEGAVKLLDFGLAKASGQAPGASSQAPEDLADSPTYPAMTQSGVILGTAAYMSPEQARGKPVDRRADIWAFGCVLFEMLTGAQAFGGETVSDVIGAVMRAEPEWSKLPASVPPVVQRLLRRCLVKDPRARLPHIGLVRLDLDEPSEPVPVAAPASTSSTRAWTAMWVALVALAVAAATLGVRLALREQSATLGVVRFDIEPPPGTRFGHTLPQRGMNPAAPNFAVSPDGRAVAFVAAAEDNVARLWVRPLASPEARVLQGTEEASFPFWSPDSHELAFFAGGALKKISLAAGSPITLCPAANVDGGTWGDDGTILFGPKEGAIWRISSNGGVPEQVTTPEPGKAVHRRPHWTGKADWFLYTSRDAASGRLVARLRSLSTGKDGEVVETSSDASYGREHIFYVRDGQLFAQPVDVVSQTPRGEAQLVVQDVAANPTGRAGFHVSPAGVLVFRSELPGAASRLLWRSRKTSASVEIDRGKQFVRLALSPEGAQAVVQIEEGTGSGVTADLWMYDLARGMGTRFTSDPGVESSPAWSPDGRRVAYSLSPNAGATAFAEMSVWVKDAGGVEPARLVSKAGGLVRDWTPDGDSIITVRNPDGNSDLWIVPLAGGPPRRLTETAFGESDARFSPDGKWLAYTSTENGQLDVYVQPYPPTGQKWPVSATGGFDPNWSSDSRRLYFATPPGPSNAADVFAVSVQSSEPRFSVPERILEAALASFRATSKFAASPDGERFLMIAPSEGLSDVAPLSVLLNWPELLHRN